MVAREHTSASRTDYAIGGAAKGVAGGGLIGALGGGLIGAAYGALAGIANPLGLAFALVVGGITAIASGWGAGLAVGFGIPAAVGAVPGALVGLGVGGGVGAGVFGAKGAFSGVAKANGEEQNYARKQQVYRALSGENIAQAKAETAEQVAAQTYAQAAQELGPYYFQKGQESVVQQIIARKQQEMANAGGAQNFSDRVGKPAVSHEQAVADSQANAAVAGPVV